MPVAVSRKQHRLMMAILHGKVDSSKSPRGVPPKSVAAKYSAPGKDAPEHSGSNTGGTWGEKHHAKAKEKVKHDRVERKKKKSKKELHKAFEELYKGKAAASIIMDDQGRFLIGKHYKGGLAYPGGHMDDADGSAEIAALREMKEESGIIGRNPQRVWSGKCNGNDTDVYLIESWTGEPQNTDEISDWRWVEPQDIKWSELRDCCRKPLEEFVKLKLGKSIKGMLAIENLQKNIIRQRGDAVFEVTHGDALRLVGNGMFRKLREIVRGMEDESFKDVQIDTYTLSVRRHHNDVYSGRVVDGHKMVYQFTNKSLPELTAALMSVFEWYLPEDEKELELLDDNALNDDAIEGGINHLIDNYKRHNIGNIYEEMETIREQIRHGMAVDLQQVEAKILTLFERLEEAVNDVAGKHNKLASMAGNDIDEIELKLRELQSKIETLSKRPETVEAYSTRSINPGRVHDENYPYLPRPQVEISPNGKIKITFGSDWTDLEKENFLHDMRARVITRNKIDA